MLTIEPGLYVAIAQLAIGPLPLPLGNGFSDGNAYRVLGGFTMSESAEMYLMLANDRAELWFISNRHVRVHKLITGAQETRFRILIGD